MIPEMFSGNVSEESGEWCRLGVVGPSASNGPRTGPIGSVPVEYTMEIDIL